MKKIMVKSWTAALAAGVLIGLAAPATADMISTDEVVKQSDRDRVRAFFEREDAQKQMNALGVSPEQAKQRVDAMTDEEVRLVAAKIDTLPAGAAISQKEWIIIALLFVLVLILI